MKELNMKMPLVFRLGIALLCVMLLSTHFTGNLYARYSTTATGSDSARVAKFDVNAQIEDNGDGSYTLTVVNNSEVTISYEIVKPPELPAGVTILLDGAQGEKTLASNSTAINKVTFQEDYDDYHVEFAFQLTVKIEQVD